VQLEQQQEQRDDQHEQLQKQLGRHLKNSKFIGVNYVFDNRLSTRITDDVFAKCGFCDSPCDSWMNCANKYCQVLKLFFKIIKPFLLLFFPSGS
jgi:predicted sulfurtransferase